MAQVRIRNWARKYLEENGPATTQEILEHIEKNRQQIMVQNQQEV